MTTMKHEAMKATVLSAMKASGTTQYVAGLREVYTKKLDLARGLVTGSMYDYSPKNLKKALSILQALPQEIAATRRRVSFHQAGHVQIKDALQAISKAVASLEKAATDKSAFIDYCMQIINNITYIKSKITKALSEKTADDLYSGLDAETIHRYNTTPEGTRLIL